MVDGKPARWVILSGRVVINVHLNLFRAEVSQSIEQTTAHEQEMDVAPAAGAGDALTVKADGHSLI